MVGLKGMDFFVITNKIYNFVICCARILHQNGVELNFLFKGIISFTMRPRASPSGGGVDGTENILQIYHLLNVIGVQKRNFCVESPHPTRDYLMVSW